MPLPFHTSKRLSYGVVDLLNNKGPVKNACGTPKIIIMLTWACKITLLFYFLKPVKLHYKQTKKHTKVGFTFLILRKSLTTIYFLKPS